MINPRCTRRDFSIRLAALAPSLGVAGASLASAISPARAKRVLSRAKVAFTHDVVVDRMSITDKINELVDRLDKEGTFTFESCFAFVESGAASYDNLKYQVVVTFLAILEMTRLKLVRITQADADGGIYISRAAADLKERAADAKTEEYK